MHRNRMNRMHRTRIDGTILNLCHAKGIGPEVAVDLLLSISRIHLQESLSIRQKSSLAMTNACREISIQPLLETDPLYQRARTRIVRMEKALTKAQRGEDHGLRRKQWRKDKDDARVILDVFAHVISRPPPETEQDRLEDARGLLVRTGELQDYRYVGMAPPTYEGKMGVRIKSSNEMLISKSRTDAIEIQDSQCGQVRLHLLGSIPDSTYRQIEALCDRGAPAVDLIDWNAFRGPMDARLQSIRIVPIYTTKPDEPKERVEITVDTGTVERDDHTKIVTMLPPGRTRPLAA